MKPIKSIFLTTIFTISTLAFSRCLKNELTSNYQKPQTEDVQYGSFDFKTVKEYNVSIVTLNNQNQPIDGVYIEVFTLNSLKNDGTLVANLQSSLIFKGITDLNGKLQCKINPASKTDSVYILTYHIGLPSMIEILLTNTYVDVILGGKRLTKTLVKSSFTKINSKPGSVASGEYTLGTWNSYGVPDYLEPVNDPISNDFLDDMNASLPERIPLPESHPQYLANDDDASLVLLKNCEAWVTFVHEGAGWHNSLGYYTYSTNNPPSSVNDIEDLTIIFPDVSHYSSGLTPGNKVQLKYYDPSTNEFTSTFPAGLSIGWFLVAQGWSSSSQTVTNGKYTHYSNVNLNVESDSELKKHNVLLYDEQRSILLLGFEDIRRDKSDCDQDFNDVVFYTTVNPISAVDVSAYEILDTEVDTDTDGDGDGDGDGISNNFDEYPTRPGLAFDNYYPAEGVYGTIVYEDLWPYKGDYDFNDLVIDYNFNQLTNSSNEIVAIKCLFAVKAIGATFHNAFGLSINTPPGNVYSVTGQLNSIGYLNIASNGTENGQSKAVIILFDDAFNALPYPGSGICVNTYSEYVYVTPQTYEVEIYFNNPITFEEIGTPPYNPFIIIDRNRGVEVHLPNYPPTDLANAAYLGTGDDNSDAGANKYYVSDQYLPWAINLPASFNYAKEKEDIREAHLMFDIWATSGGYTYMDWYESKGGYRNSNKIYNK